MLAILHKVALATHKQACTYLLCVSVSQYLNMEPIDPDTTLLYLLPYSYYMNGYIWVCKMRRCSSLFRFSIEKVISYAHIFFLPFAMESVITTDHYDLTVVHQIPFPSVRTYCDNFRKFCRGTSV